MSRQRSREVIEQAEYVTIGELVRLTAVRYSTLKFYTEEGMLPFEQAEENLTRRYRRVESLERIAQIRRLREQFRRLKRFWDMVKSRMRKEAVMCSLFFKHYSFHSGETNKIFRCSNCFFKIV